MLDVFDHNTPAPELLRSFVAAADSGSFTGAARQVNRTQSAISMQIKRLEDDLGRTLFSRLPRGVALTPDGETLYRYAQRILHLYDEAAVRLGAPQASGAVRFGVPEDFAAQRLPGILARFAARHPLVRVDVHCDASPRLVTQLDEGGLDLALCTSADGREGGRPLGNARLRWLGPEHALAGVDDPLPVAVFHAGCPYRQGALQALKQAGIGYRIAYSSPGVAGVLAAVRAGLAVAPLMDGVEVPGCRPWGRSEGLPKLPPVVLSLHGPGKGSNGAVQALEGFVREALA